MSVINEVDSGGRTALWWAAMRGDHLAVASLLEHGADSTIATAKESLPADAAFYSRNQCCIRLFLPKCDIHRRTHAGWTPLHQACHSGCDEDIIVYLLRQGADVDAQDDANYTPLMYAAQENQANVCKLLISYGANLGIVNLEGETCLSIAFINERNGVIKILLTSQADYHFKTDAGETILHHAAQYGDMRCLHILHSFELQGINTKDKVMRSSPSQIYNWVKGLTALEIAEKRPDMGTEWLDSFQNLIYGIEHPETRAPVNSDLGDVEDFQDALEYQA